MNPAESVMRLEDLIPEIIDVKDEPIIRELYDIERILHPYFSTCMLSGDNLKLYSKEKSNDTKRKKSIGTIVLGVNGLRDAAVIIRHCPLNNMTVVLDTEVNHHGYGSIAPDIFPTSAIIDFMRRIVDKGIPSVIYSTAKEPVPFKLSETAKDLDISIFYHSEMKNEDVRIEFLKAVKGNGYLLRYG